MVIATILVIYSRREDRNNTLEGRFSHSIKKVGNKRKTKY